MKTTSRIGLLLLLLAQGKAIAADRFDGADEFIRAAMKHWQVPGVAVAVVKDGKVVFKRGYGVRETGSEKKVSTATLFDIASCTKSFTAASVALLVDQGKLSWDDPVSKHLPNIRFPHEYLTRHVTLRDLLCHRTGLQRGDLIFSQQNIKAEELLRRVRFLQIESPFRTKHTYNNLMYAVLKEVVAKVSKQPWERFLAESLLGPLGMKSTTFSINEKAHHNFAARHWLNEGKLVSRGIRKSGGIYSSAEDMAKWVQFQLASGRRGNRQIISEKLTREMHALHHSIPVRRSPKNNPYAARFYGAGLGWFTLDYRGKKLVIHTGAWGAIVGLVPEENLGVVVLSNLDWNYGMTALLMYRMLDLYCTKSKTVWDTSFKPPYVEAPGQAYLSRDRERAKLDASRPRNPKPALPIDKYAGEYRSSLFGDIQIVVKDRRLSLRIGHFTTPLTHREKDTFYVKAPTRMNYDWLVRFETKDGIVKAVTLQYVGWHEPDVRFQRLRGSGQS